MTRSRSRTTRWVIFFLALAAIVFWVEFFDSAIPDVSLLRSQYPQVEYHGRDEPFSVSLQRGRPSSWVNLSEISKFAVGAVIVSEDWAFFQHHGFDSNQIREAIKDDLEQGRLARGASTITQQVVKNVFLERDKTFTRKLKELYLATQLEKKVKKWKILESYLNIAEWGEGIFGMKAAARQYFGKAPAELTPKEGAFLAMLLPSPKRYSQSFRNKQLTDFAQKSIQSILEKMVQANYLSEEEAQAELARPLSFELFTPSVDMTDGNKDN